MGGGGVIVLRNVVTCLFLLLQECSNLFSAGGAGKLADEYGLHFLGSIPLDQVKENDK